MKQQGKYILGTLEEIVCYLLKDSFDGNDNLLEDACFADCDFAIANEEYIDSKDFKEIELNSDGWYGIKRIDAGFNSSCLCLISDYYGGGCADFRSITPEIDKNTVISEVKDMISITLNYFGGCYEDTLLIGVIEQEKFYFTFGSDHKFPYNGGHVVVIAETLEEATRKFRERFPDRMPGFLNCAFCYSQQEWDKACMSKQGSCCHMVIG